VLSSLSHCRTVSSRDVPIGTTRVRRLLVVSPRKTIKRRPQSTSSNLSASISPRRMPVSSAAMIIDRRSGEATASNAASSCSETRRRRLLSSRSSRTSTSVPRRNGVRSRYSRPTAQLSMCRNSPSVRLIDAGMSFRPSRPLTVRGFFKSATKSSMSAVRISAIRRSPKRSIRGLSR